MSTDCIEWQYARTPQGYGKVWHNGYMWLATRLIATLIYGEEALAGKDVMHTCDNPPCVNPAHLVIGTRKDNTNDMVEKGRSSRGEHRPGAKLLPEHVRAIRQRYADGESFNELAAAYEVHYMSIHNIVRGKSWRHVK